MLPHDRYICNLGQTSLYMISKQFSRPASFRGTAALIEAPERGLVLAASAHGKPAWRADWILPHAQVECLHKSPAEISPQSPMNEGRHDWNISDITWDRNEMRAEMRGERSPEQSAGASSAQQVPICGNNACSSFCSSECPFT